MYKTITAIPAVAAAVALTACSPSSAPAAATAASHPAAALSCHQQYAGWQHGPARAPAKTVIAAFQAVQSAAASEDIPAMTAALKRAGAAAATLARYPMPACADPGGYWNALLARVRAAGDNAGSASGLGALVLAEAPLKDVPALQAKLGAELKKTTA